MSCSAVLTPGTQDFVNRRGFTWTSAQTEHLQLYVESGSFAETQLEKLKDRGERAWSRVLSLLNEPTYRNRVSVFVVSSRARMQALVGRETNGQALPNRNAVFYVMNADLDASGAHELCHVLAKNLWGDSADWINEGLAVYADDRWDGHPLHAVASYHLQQRTLIPLRRLIEDFNRHDPLVAYPEIGSFTKFLYERYGRAAVREIWAGGISAISRATGKRFDELERDWHATIAPRSEP